MKRQKRNDLLSLVQSFFANYLERVRGASPHTTRAYRDTLKLFFLFMAGQEHRSAANLTLDDIRADVVLSFLDYLESERGNTAATRNYRLAVLRSFARHLLRNDPTHAEQYGRILALPSKRATSRPATYLEPEDARAVISAVEPKSTAALRDRALLLFLYNTGARVSEALNVRMQQLHLNPPRQVRLFGKGRKERLCPLWPETAAALRKIANTEADGEAIFRNAQGAPISRDGVAYILQKYLRQASETLPHLRSIRVTPHVMRHSCAVALLQAGIDISVIRDYLGHASVATTSRYVTSNLRMKREVLDAFWKRSGLMSGSARPWRASPKLLAFLQTL
jgi:site-specific recombinase XerD